MKNFCFPLILLVSVISIIGCASISELRSDGTSDIWYSEKSVDDVSQCILFGWQDRKMLIGTMNVYIQPYVNGQTVYTEDNTFVSDIISYNGKTKISYYHQNEARNDEMKGIILNCI